MDDLTYTAARWRDAGVVVAYELAMEHGPATVAYTHLTLPTN